MVKELEIQYKNLEIKDKDPHHLKDVLLKFYDPIVTNLFLNQ